MFIDFLSKIGVQRAANFDKGPKTLLWNPACHYLRPYEIKTKRPEIGVKIIPIVPSLRSKMFLEFYPKIYRAKGLEFSCKAQKVAPEPCGTLKAL